MRKIKSDVILKKGNNGWEAWQTNKLLYKTLGFDEESKEKVMKHIPSYENVVESAKKEKKTIREWIDSEMTDEVKEDAIQAFNGNYRHTLNDVVTYLQFEKIMFGMGFDDQGWMWKPLNNSRQPIVSDMAMKQIEKYYKQGILTKREVVAVLMKENGWSLAEAKQIADYYERLFNSRQITSAKSEEDFEQAVIEIADYFMVNADGNNIPLGREITDNDYMEGLDDICRRYNVSLRPSKNNSQTYTVINNSRQIKSSFDDEDMGDFSELDKAIEELCEMYADKKEASYSDVEKYLKEKGFPDWAIESAFDDFAQKRFPRQIKSAWVTDNPVRDEGWDAFNKGLSQSDNPYKFWRGQGEEQQYNDWDEGWEAAYYESTYLKSSLQNISDMEITDFDEIMRANISPDAEKIPMLYEQAKNGNKEAWNQMKDMIYNEPYIDTETFNHWWIPRLNAMEQKLFSSRQINSSPEMKSISDWMYDYNLSIDDMSKALEHFYGEEGFHKDELDNTVIPEKDFKKYFLKYIDSSRGLTSRFNQMDRIHSSIQSSLTEIKYMITTVDDETGKKVYWHPRDGVWYYSQSDGYKYDSHLEAEEDIYEAGQNTESDHNFPIDIIEIKSSKQLSSRFNQMNSFRQYTLSEAAQYLSSLFFDLRTIHFLTTGSEFYTYHELAQELYEQTEDYYDDIVETAIGYDSNVQPMFVLPGDWNFVDENGSFDTNAQVPQTMILERLECIYDVLENVKGYDSMVASKLDAMKEYYDKEIYKLKQALK